MQLGPEGVANFGVEGGFFGTYELAFGEEAGRHRVLGGAGFAFGGAGSGGFKGCAGINRHEAGDERALQERR